MTQSFITEFFSRRGAVFADFQIRFGEIPVDFNALERQTTVSVMLYHSLLRITSSDNLKFLQGQFTCDLKEVSATQWRYGAMCTNKGRMIANFLLLQTAENQHLIRVSTGTIEPLQNTLKKFVPFYKGTLDNLGEQFVLLGLNGTDATDLIQSIFIQVPEINGAIQTDEAIVVRLAETRYECWVKNTCLASVWPRFIEQATPTGCAYWELLNIRAGLGEVRQTTIEEWTPHMLNLQITGAISFKKGCYTGQEIVARTEYRGQQKRAMYRIAGRGMAPATGSPLTEDEHTIGEIVMAQMTGDKQWEALAVLSDKNLEELKPNCAGETVQILDLPYSIRKTISATP